MGPEFSFNAYVRVWAVFPHIYIFPFIVVYCLLFVCSSVSYLNKFAQGVLAYLRLCDQLENYLQFAA